jgi:GNAT superfamily N-acetyltransferase
MHIRPAMPNDASRVSALSSQLGYEAPPQHVCLFLDSLVDREDHRVFVAEDDLGNVNGWVHVFVSRRLFVAPFAELGGMVVDLAHRRAGLGRALLASAEEWAALAGCSLLRIRTNALRLEAPACYADMGYQVLKTQTVFEKSLPRGRQRSRRGIA